MVVRCGKVRGGRYIESCLLSVGYVHQVERQKRNGKHFTPGFWVSKAGEIKTRTFSLFLGGWGFFTLGGKLAMSVLGLNTDQLYESVFVKNCKESFTRSPERTFNAAMKQIMILEDRIRKQNHAFYLMKGTEKFKYSSLFKPSEEIKIFHSMTSGEKFFRSKSWLVLRHEFLISLPVKKCAICGFDDKNGSFHVDHIKPRSVYPELSLEIKNLQLLCRDCNMGKTNKVSGIMKLSRIHPEIKLRKKSQN